MRSELELRARLDEIRQSLQETTRRIGQGSLAGLDISGIATRVALVRCLEWVLGETEQLPVDTSPHLRPLDEV
jgi:hypothetical protein